LVEFSTSFIFTKMTSLHKKITNTLDPSKSDSSFQKQGNYRFITMVQLIKMCSTNLSLVELLSLVTQTHLLRSFFFLSSDYASHFSRRASSLLVIMLHRPSPHEAVARTRLSLLSTNRHAALRAFHPPFHPGPSSTSHLL
jgi:hypothetical protein